MADQWDDEIHGGAQVRDDDAPDDWENALDEKGRLTNFRCIAK